MKGKGEVSRCRVNGIIASVQETERAREGVAILLNDVLHSAVVDFECVSSRILWIKFKFSRVKVCVVVGYESTEGDGEERDRFWSDMDRSLGDLNGWIRDRTRVTVISAFGVPGENVNGRRVVEFCAERGLCMGNTYFKHRTLHKYTRVARSQDEVEIKSMIDLVLAKRDMLQDVRVVRGLGRGLSGHHVILCKVRLVGKEGYAWSLEGRGVEWDGDDNVKHMWEQVKRAMVGNAREVYGSVRMEGKNTKSVW